MPTTFTELYQERCDLAGKPVFWNPQPFLATDFLLFSDENLPVDPDWNTAETISRIIALGLSCEIPVGQFILAASKREIPSNPILQTLLKSNITDEARHDQGFKYALKAYPVDSRLIKEAQNITAIWQSVDEHPITCATALEVGVFLCTLGALRLFGGKNLALMSSAITFDEFRHAATNRGLMTLKGLEFSSEILELIKQTIEWVFCDLQIPRSILGIALNKDFFLDSSEELIDSNQAKQLDDLVNYSNHLLPFELSNSRLYDRGSDQ